MRQSFVVLLVLATTLAIAPLASSAQSEGAEAVQFTIENLQPGSDAFFFTEPWVGLHNGDFDLFDLGERATPGLESLAEGGNTELLGSEFAAQGRLQATVGNGEVQFISPGETIEGSIDIINPQNYRYFSFASMIIPSNDAFFGNEDPFAYELFDADGNFTGPITIDIFGSDIYDSGTEVNDGQGAAGFSLGLNGDGGISTDDLSSTVAPHPDLLENILGFQTAAGTVVGDPLTLEEPIARITIDLGASINTVAAVGPLFNGSVVEDAPADDAGDAPGTVELRDLNFGRYLETRDGGLVGTAAAASAATQWEIVDAGDGYYFIQSLTDGRYLDADNSAVDYDVNLGEADRQVRWELIDAGNGAFYIRNVAFDRLLDADRRGDFNVDSSTQRRPDTQWEILAVDSDSVPAPAPDPAPAPAPGDAIGAVFVATNDLVNNEIASFARAADGTLSPVGNFATGGAGSTEFDGGEGLDPLISADSLVVTEDEQFLLAVNAGSDSISSFAINDDFSLTLVSVVDSGGVGPNSIAIDNGYVFVTNIDRDGLALGEAGTTRGEPNDEGNVVGFTISSTGELVATGHSVDLDNRPANIEFSTDGNRIVVSSITSGSVVLPGENGEASVYSFNVLRDGSLLLADTNTPTLRGNSEGRNLPSAIDFDITVQDGREFVVVTEAREFNSEGEPPALPALQAGSVTVYELGADSSLTITEGDFAFTDGSAAAPNDFGTSGQQLTACWIDFGHGTGADIFYVSNAISASISSVRIAGDGTLEVIETIAAQGVSGFDQPEQTGEAVFGTTDGFIDLDVSPDGAYLYQLEGLSGNIGVYALDGLGGLTQIQELTGELPDIDTQGIISIGGGA